MSANVTVVMPTTTAAPIVPDLVQYSVIIIIVGFLAIIGGYIVSLILQKRAIDMVQTAGTSSLAATQYLISQSVYYGAYERSEILRTVASIIGVDQIRDTAITFLDSRKNSPIPVYPPPGASTASSKPAQ